ncbi:MAG: DEAD/DEAH box helicase [Gammaproteobacteria bacterium]
MTMSADTPLTFRDLQLPEPLLQVLDEVGYETPSPIQAATIPHLLRGTDVLGQAQTGTGKTAAFALPALARLDLRRAVPQVLVLAPTRELAIQVAEAFQRYAKHLKGFHVLPIYGGQSYGPQLAALRRGVHVVVGTPGRITDHLQRGTLKLDTITTLVLDEADEMLRMGFIDDVEAILKLVPPERQVALFSATMPGAIRRIAQTHLRSPAEITIEAKTRTATNVRQRYWMVSGMNKLDALTRILEAEPFDGMIIFTRTKTATVELAERLEARGFAVAALNGDIPQAQRERTVARLKDGQIDIAVATDVAARGLDVERISHVVNYDIPHDTESYVHRIGRTGRAGRSGDAILFIAPRERHMLKVIERATRQPITPMQLPTVEAVNQQRVARFAQRISETLSAGGLEGLQQVVESYVQTEGHSLLEVAAALAQMAQGSVPLLLDVATSERRRLAADGPAPERGLSPVSPPTEPPARTTRPAPRRAAAEGRPPERTPARARATPARDAELETYRVAVGHAHGVKPANLVGAIANEAGLDSQFIGRIEIFEDYSHVDLPRGMPKETFRHLQKVWVAGQQLQIAPATAAAPERAARPRPPHKPGTRPRRY